MFISENAGFYNQNVSKINLMIEKKDYKNAYLEIKKIDRFTIYNNHDLNKLKVLLSVRLNLGLNDLMKNQELDDYLLPVVLTKMGQRNKALLFLKKKIIKMSNDSLIKLYETYSQNISFNRKEIKPKSTIFKYENSMNNADALSLLELMKKKEKYLSYKNNVK